jgi:uroporphyrinogen III methyltransferase/synthase
VETPHNGYVAASGGHVWLVGAGPGDPGLLTLAAAAALRSADVVVYDALVATAILSHAPPSAELIFAGKRASAHEMAQGDIEALLVERAQAGKRVVRLKGGDPFVFGRGGEEAQACRRAAIPFTIVPGISSALAAPAYAGIPVTHRGLAGGFTVRTAQASAVNQPAETLVLLMGASSVREALAAALREGRGGETPAAAIRWGTRNDQQVVRATIDTLADEVEAAGLTAPIVTVIGEVVGLAGELDWFRPGPLAGKRVVVTRARSQASELAAKFEELGAFVVEAPLLTIAPRTADLVSDERVGSRWDWIVFTSANGVVVVFDALAAGGRDARSLATTRVAAIGEATGVALRQRGVIADFVPSRATSACLAEEMPRVNSARILLPVSALTDDTLATALRARGGLIEQVAVYDTTAAPLDAQLLREVQEADAITFTSASTARFLAAALPAGAAPAAKLVSIGPKTSEAVMGAFGRVDREAASPALEALVQATMEALQ